MNRRSPGEGAPVDLGVDGYEDAVEVGRGGFAIVYRAWQPGFDRHVAIKVVSSNLDATAMSRFERECLAIGALSEHPNIVTVHELGWTADGRPFIVMEFLTGGSLGARVDRDGPLTWQQATEMTIKVAGALESAHRAGVLHRDVKPDNVLVSRYGDIKLGDFGIARIQGHSETMTGGVTASWSHAPPELVAGQRPTVASDVYSLSSMLYTLVAGDPPFYRRGDEGLLPMLARIPSEPVPDLRPAGVPAALCRVIEHGMAKDPADRPSSAAEIGRRLQEAQAAARQPVTTLPLEIVDVAGKIGIQLPSLDPAASAQADEGPGGTTNLLFPTYAAGAPPVPADAPSFPLAPPVPLSDPPPVHPPTVVEPIAEPPPPPARRSRRSVVLALVALAAVAGAVGAVLVLGGGGDDRPTAQPAPTTVQEPVPTTATPSTVSPTTATVPPTTAPVVHFTVTDELQPADASEEVELTIDGGPPVRFAGSPTGVSQPVPLTVPTAGRHSYRVVVRTTSKTGATTTHDGVGNIDVREGGNFEVSFVGPTRACLSLDGVCQE